MISQTAITGIFVLMKLSNGQLSAYGGTVRDENADLNLIKLGDQQLA